MITTRARLVPHNQTVVDPVDFFQGDGFTRLTGVTPTGLALQVFFDNQIQPWPLQTGLSILDAQVASGTIYFNEIPGSPGFYSLRFRPDAVGYWRINLSYATGAQVIIHDFDVTGEAPAEERGLKSSFLRPECRR